MPRKKRRRDDPPRRHWTGTSGGGSDDFLGQLGLFETGNGLPYGPMSIAVAILAALVVYPISRLIKMVIRR